MAKGKSCVIMHPVFLNLVWYTSSYSSCHELVGIDWYEPSSNHFRQTQNVAECRRCGDTYTLGRAVEQLQKQNCPGQCYIATNPHCHTLPEGTNRHLNHVCLPVAKYQMQAHSHESHWVSQAQNCFGVVAWFGSHRMLPPSILPSCHASLPGLTRD